MSALKLKLMIESDNHNTVVAGECNEAAIGNATTYEPV